MKDLSDKGWTRRLIEVGAAMSAERDHDRLIERILKETMEITRADGGTLYLLEPGLGCLHFAILKNTSLGLHLGGSTGRPIPYPPIPLRDPDSGQPNLANVSTFVAVERRSVNIKDAYTSIAFDFSGTQAYDERTGYRSKSFLTLPLVSFEDRLIGVLQLINAQDENGQVVPFSKASQPVIEALASQAAVAIENHQLFKRQHDLAEAYQRLIEIGTALSSERDHSRLLETILEESRSITRADGGTLYLYDEEAEVLRFAILRNESLDLKLGGTTGADIPYPPVPLKVNGEPNQGHVAAYVALERTHVSLDDVYEASAWFDFSGTKAYDTRTGYRSKSFLTLPLENPQGQLIGVLQLINAQDEKGRVVAFSDEALSAVQSLASQAAVAIDNRNLLEGQRRLLESFIHTIARAIDLKSPYTGGHCQRVPILAEMIARAAMACDEEPFQNFFLDDDELYELSIAAWLHDCGKVTTPDYVVDKATKLETIFDRIKSIETRFLLLERNAELLFLRASREPDAHPEALEEAFHTEQSALRAALAFVIRCNTGSERMSEADVERLGQIATRWHYVDAQGQSKPTLTDDELLNLSIRSGTLNAVERGVIQSHMTATIDMLERLPFPKGLRRVPEYAGAHHEHMDGKGYPRGLRGDEMSIPARIMAVADVFEALTAGDRPYKRAKKLSESIRILSHMANSGHIDPSIFRLFLRSGVHQDYAERHLLPEQIDEVDVERYLQ